MELRHLDSNRYWKSGCTCRDDQTDVAAAEGERTVHTPDVGAGWDIVSLIQKKSMLWFQLMPISKLGVKVRVEISMKSKEMTCRGLGPEFLGEWGIVGVVWAKKRIECENAK